MAARRVSLAQQLEAVQLACTRQATLARGQSVKALRTRTQEEFDLDRLQAVTRTLAWLQTNQEELTGFLTFTAEQRAAIIAEAQAKFGSGV